MTTGTTPGSSSRFPGFDVVARSTAWDPVTAAVVLGRISPTSSPRFFPQTHEGAARALLDRLLAQDAPPKIPLFELVDARLALGETDGWRYDDMPEDGHAWLRTVQALDEDAAAQHHGRPFAELGREAQIELLEAVRIADRWHDLPAGRVWNLWMRYACAAFYSHPWAWNEIGFGGPAYPTGYKNLGVGGRERWEVPERDAASPERWADRVDAARERHARRQEAP